MKKNEPHNKVLKIPSIQTTLARCITLLLLICGFSAAAQDTRITGKVLDSAGSPVSGASITVKGTRNGVASDATGSFTITAPANGTLVISAIGYGSTEVAIGSRSQISTSLYAAATQSLDQVIVVGYGTLRKRDLTGSVASVSGAELAKQPVLTATQAVQGKVAGVQVITSGDPNALPVIRIRGTGSVLAGVNPLYVVDGVINDDIRNINSSDIVSMEILKDASATAIYGMRASNGVILITTKRGRTGKMVISYDGSVGVKEASHLVNMAGANQYAGYLNEANIYYGSGDSLVKQAQLRAGANTDWYDEILKKGLFQNHNVSVSGGSDKINYFLSAGLLTDEGIIRTNRFNRFTLRNNNDYKITDNFKISTIISYSRTDSRFVDLGAFNVAYRAAPYVPALRDGKYGNTSLSNNVGNPILDQDKNNNTGRGDRFQGTIVGEYKPVTWLTLRTSFGIDKNNFNTLSYAYAYANSGPDNVFLTAGSNQVRPNSNLTIAQNQGNRWIWDNTATVVKKFGDHSFNLVVGTTSEDIRSQGITAARQNVPTDRNQWYLNTGSTINQINTGFGDKSTRNSYLARLNYNFNDRYFLTATGRYDGTSRFPSYNRWGFFPSIGAGWAISSESFMANQKVFSNLKLRASYGKVGNDQIGSNLFTSVATPNLPYFFNNIPVLGFRLDQLADPNLKWEVTTEVNLGLDFALLRNRLSGTIDVYNRQVNNALIIVNVNSALGDPDGSYITNAVTIRNRGIELGLNWADNINRNWKYNISGNIARNQNKILSLNNGTPLTDGNVSGQGATTRTDVGQPIGSFYLLEAVGVFKTAAEVAASAQPNARPGDLRYRDANGDKVINDDDRTYQGSYQPKFTFGINGGLTYKMIDLSVGGYGTTGSKIYNGKKAARSDFRDNIEEKVANGRWTPNNPNSNIPRANTSILPNSTYFLEKGDFFRINNLTLGYTLAKGSLSRIKLQNLRVYVTAQNLVTFTGYSGFSPEVSVVNANASSNVLAAGIESSIYPTTRTFAVGVNLGF